MPFNQVYVFDNMRFYEVKDPLNGGAESKARAVQSDRGENVVAVYRLPMSADRQGFERFRRLADYTESRFAIKLPQKPQQFQDAYHANQRWVTGDGKLVLGLNKNYRLREAAPQLAQEFIEHEGHPLTVLGHVLAAAGFKTLLEKRIKQAEIVFEADGLSAAQAVERGIFPYTTIRQRRGLKGLAVDAFLDLTEHESGFVLKRTNIQDLIEANRIENEIVDIYNRV